MNKQECLGCVVILFILGVCGYIYSEKEGFELKCIVSSKDGNKYCVRERSKLDKAANLLATVTEKCKKLVKYVEKQELNITKKDTLILKMVNDDSIYYRHNLKRTYSKQEVEIENTIKLYSNYLRVDVKKSNTDKAYFVIQKESYGRSSIKARKNAEQINYKYNFTNNQVVLNAFFLSDVKNIFKDEEVKITFFVPEETTVYFDNSMRYFLMNVRNKDGIDEREMGNHHFRMKKNYLEWTDCKKEEEKIEINSTDRELHFYDNKFSASVRKLEGTFPDYINLFPKENLFSIEVEKNDILEALDRATVVAEGFIPVKIEILNPETLKITTINKDIGGGNEEVSIKTLGLDIGDITGFTMSFNPNYLIQGIEVLDGKTVYLRFSGNEKPVVIQGEHETFKYLLMPVRPN